MTPTSRRIHAMLLGLATAGLPSCGPDPGTTKGPSAGPSSVLLVTFDTTRADRIGAYGHAGARTATLDRLARQGVLFEQAFAPAPITLPSHASLLTGVPPVAHGVRDNAVFELSEQALSLPEVLRERGFRTAAFVSSYVLDAKFGLDQGFEVYRGPAISGLSSNPDSLEIPADQVVDHALDWFDTVDADQRYFAWVHFFDPHAPYQPPPSPGRPADPYDAEIAHADAQLGRLLAGLDARGLAEELLVIATADHGEGLGDHQEVNHGVFLYQPTMRVPLLLCGPPLGAAAGTRVSRPVSTVGVAATVLEVLGILPEAMPDTREATLVTAAGGLPEYGEAAPLYLETWLPYFSHGWHPYRALVWQGYKLIEGPRQELYDLSGDPTESTDLALERPDLAERMGRRLARFLEEHPPLDWVTGRTLEPGEREKLEALGYTGGTTTEDALHGDLPDPKDRLGDLQRLEDARQFLLRGRELLARAAAAPEAEREALAQEGREQLQTARQMLLALQEENPGHVQLSDHLGTLHASMGQYAEAVPYYEQAVALRPRSPVTWYNLGICYQRTGRLDQAFAQMRKAIEVAPAYADPYGFFVWYYKKEGDLPRAAGWLDALLRALGEDSLLVEPTTQELRVLQEALRRQGKDMIRPEDDG